MKRLSTIAVLTAVALSATTVLADSTTEEATKLPATAAAAPAEVGTPAQAVTATTEAAKPASSFSVWYEVEAVSSPLDGSAGTTASIDHYPGAKFKFGPEKKLAVGVQAPFSNGVGPDTDAFTLNDINARFYYPIYKTEGGVNFTGQVRFYLPTSDSSQESGKIVGVNPRVYTTWNLGRFEFLNLFMGSANLYGSGIVQGKQVTSINPTTKVEETATVTDRVSRSTGSVANYLKTAFRLNKMFAPYVVMYPKFSWSRGTSGAAFNDLHTEIGLSITPTDKIEIAPYLVTKALGEGNQRSANSAGVLYFSYSFL